MSLLRRLARLLLPILFFVSFLLSLSAARSLEQLPDLRTLSLGSANLTGKAALAMLDREQEEERPVSFAVWGQETGATAQNPDLGRNAQVDVLLFCGNPSLLISSAGPLEDASGCLIDRSTAQSLFGSSAPVGSALEYGGRTLTVRGIVDSDRPLLLAQAPPESGSLNRVTFRMPEGASQRKLLGEFENRHYLSGSWTAQRTWASLARFFALLAPSVLLLSVVLHLLKTAFSLTEYPFPFLVFLLAAGALWFLTLWLTDFSFQIPEEFLPSQWSNFDFWGALWEQKKAEFLLLLASEKAAPELALLLPALQACGFGLLALLLFPLSLARLKPQNERDLWALSLLFLLLAFAGSVLLGGGALARDKLLWLCPTAYLWAAYFSSRLRSWSESLREDRPLPAAPRRAHVKARRYKTS